MYKSSEIQTLHMEVTSRCNASCPMCMRNVLGGKASEVLPLTELSLDQVKSILPKSFIGQLKRMYMCGNYGDPGVARETLEIFSYFREINHSIELSLFTNGSVRNPHWWAQLAQCRVVVRFGIDGLSDTNSIYRRNTQWDKIINNARAFIAAGGIADWDFIVFEHNEHQVEEARQLSRAIGFRNFNVKKTGRFYSYTKSQVKNSQQVLGVTGEPEYEIGMPQNPKYRNSALLKENKLIDKYGSLEAYFNLTPIECRVQKEKSVYLSAEGLVFPCCWTANQMYVWFRKPQQGEIWERFNELPGAKNFLNACKRSLPEIVDDPVWQNWISSTWDKKGLDQGKLKVCAKTCGKEFDPFRAQFTEESKHASV